MTSQFTFNCSLANSATSSNTWICVPHPIMVTSLPVRKMSAVPNGQSNASSGTSSTAARYSVFGSKTMHGSYQLCNGENHTRFVYDKEVDILYLLCRPVEDLLPYWDLVVQQFSIRACAQNKPPDSASDTTHHGQPLHMVHVSSTIHNRINFRFDSDTWLLHSQSGIAFSVVFFF